MVIGFNIKSCPHQCRCSCHSHPGSKHVAACCTPCDICGGNIIMGQMEDHLRMCHKGEKIPSLAEQINKRKIKDKIAEIAEAWVAIKAMTATFHIKVLDREKGELLSSNLLRDWEGITFSSGVRNFGAADYNLVVTIPLNPQLFSVSISTFLGYIRDFCKEQKISFKIS